MIFRSPSLPDLLRESRLIAWNLMCQSFSRNLLPPQRLHLSLQPLGYAMLLYWLMPQVPDSYLFEPSDGAELTDARIGLKALGDIL